ncbi:phosphate ABC transporter permease subunit PstC [soil metagenome]
MSTPDLAASGTGAPLARRSLEASSPRYGEKAIFAFLALCGVLSVGVTSAIVISLLLPTIDFFRQVSLEQFFADTVWAPRQATGRFGVWPIVVGTINVVVWALLVAIPVGLTSAIYLSEYAGPRQRRLIKPVLEVLAGIPTVAIGLFAFWALRPAAALALPFLDWTSLWSVGVAGVAVGLMIVPLVASISDDAMRAVPRALREGGYGLGASKLKVSLRIVFPAAVSGIVASIVLAGSRAVGETMVVLIAAGRTPNLTLDPTQSVQTMTAYIAGTATGDIPTGTLDYDTLFAVGSLLFVMTLVLNVLAIRLVRRFREVYE